MAKFKTTYFCQNCGYETAKWLGKCPSCNEWNSLVEEILEKTPTKVPDWKTSTTSRRSNKATAIHEIIYQEEARIRTGDTELNRVLGGGIVPGSLILIGGEPGIGKSTLMLQLALTITDLKEIGRA